MPHLVGWFSWKSCQYFFLAGFLAINAIYLHSPDSSVSIITDLQARWGGIRFGLPGGIYILRNFETDFVAAQRLICVHTYLHSPIRKDGAVLNSVEGLLYRIIKTAVGIQYLSSSYLYHLYNYHIYFTLRI